MMPVYRYMDSNPHQRNQSPFPQLYFPCFEAVPPHLKVDPSKSPMMYESWPCSSDHGYSVPYHGYCNHGNFPGCYSFRPPCRLFAPSPSFHQYPTYPTFPEAYPVFYVPHPHYSNEQPRYEYDKDGQTNFHCYECPNHSHNQKNDRSLKIEEQEPDAEKKEGDLVVPIQPRSCPHPIVWIPPEYMKNEEYGKRNDESEVSNWDKATKSLKPTEQQPRVWNGWFPLDMNGLKSLMQGEGDKNSQNQQINDKMTQFPFPFFWLPSNGKQKEDENQDKRTMTASDHSKQAPVSCEFIPVEPSVNDVRMDKPQSNKETSHNENASETMGKTSNKKYVPVKQMEVHKEDKSEGTEKRGKDINVRPIEDEVLNKLDGTAAKRKSQSPPKTSKLPAVCLRVDPLPKKRDGNGSSRSPSAPNGQPEETLTKASPAPGLKNDFAANTKNLNGSLDKVEPGGKERKNIQVMEKRSLEKKAGECTGASQAQVLENLPIDFQEVSGKPTMERTENDSHFSKTEEGIGAISEEVMGAEKAADTKKATNRGESALGQRKAEIERMSDAEAAKLIRSAYRGFEVRKWEPLKKLKQIAKAREQVDEVRSRIQALESSSDLNKDNRQRLLVGEMIMSLLLKLDTIQGLHSSVRDARKSLVRELVTLQEKLDSLTSKWTEEKAKDLATAESVGCPSIDACRSDSTEKESKKASTVCISSTNEKGNDIKEPNQDTCMVDEKSNVKDEETTEPLIVDHALDGKMENESTEVACDIEYRTAPRIQDGDVSPYLEHLTGMSSVPEQMLNANEFVEANDLRREGKPGMVEMNDPNPVNNYSEEDKLRSLPNEMTDHVDDVCEPEKMIRNSNGEKESQLPINPALPAEVENLRRTEKDKEIDLLEELPVGKIDDEPPILEFEKCEMHETGENNILSSSEGCLAERQSDEQLLEATSGNCVKGQKEFTKSPKLEVEVQQTREKEVNRDNNFESVFVPEEVPLTVSEENNGKVHQEEDDYGAITAVHMASSESEVGSVATEEKEVLFEDKKEVQQPLGAEEMEEIKLDKIEFQEQSCMNSENKTTNIPRETMEEGVLVETDAHSESNKEQEWLHASSAVSQTSNDEHDLSKIEGDNKLIDENKKLREMMEKLIEAGKDQLTVISNLIGRVKDLEEKLSRNKSISKPRYRKARYAPSRSRLAKATG